MREWILRDGRIGSPGRSAPGAAGALAALVLVASCSGSDDASGVTTPAERTTGATESTSAAPESTIDPTRLAAAYAEAGPFAVGVTTLELDKGPLVEVWYPAVAGTTGTDTYDVRDYTPPAIKALLTGDAPAAYSYSAGRDAAFADGAFPVVLFSHGFTGIRVQSSFLTSHLASYGMIVVSPEHPSRDLFNVLGSGGNPVLGFEPVADLDALAARLGPDWPRFVMMTACPLMHGTGQFSCMIALLLGGAAVTLPSRSYDPAELFSEVQRNKVNSIIIVGQAFAGQPDAAARGQVKAGQQAEQHGDGRGLAGAVAAQQPEHRAGRDAEGQIVDGDDLAVHLAQVPDVDGRFLRHRIKAPSPPPRRNACPRGPRP